MRALSCALMLAVGLIIGGPVSASTYTFPLEGIQETPPVPSPGTGSATLIVDDGTGSWTLTGSFSSLLGTTTAAHIHIAPPGSPGPVIAPLTIAPPGLTSGSLSGAGIFAPVHLTALYAGDLYVNVHSVVFPGGEIRGQIVPEPTSLALLGLCLLPLIRRRG